MRNNKKIKRRNICKTFCPICKNILYFLSLQSVSYTVWWKRKQKNIARRMINNFREYLVIPKNRKHIDIPNISCYCWSCNCEYNSFSSLIDKEDMQIKFKRYLNKINFIK